MVHAEKPIDEGGFSDAGRAEQREGAACNEPWIECLDSFTATGAERDHSRTDRDRLDFGFCDRRVEMEVGFVEHHDRLGSAFPGDGEVALDAAKIEVLIKRGDEQD